MPNIDGLPLEAIEDPELRDAVTRAREAGGSGEWFIRLMARAPAYAPRLLRMLEVINNGGDLSPRLTHLERLLLAQMAGDSYTAALSANALASSGLSERLLTELRWEYASSSELEQRERLALAFAEQMFLDAKKVDDDVFDEMRRHFTEPQIMRIAVIAGVNYAISLLMSTTGATPADDTGPASL